MASASRPPKAGPDGSDRAPCLRPRLSSLLTICFLVVTAIALAYVAGVMSGRAYSGKHGAAASAPVSGSAPSAPGAAADAGPDDAADQQILAPEDLHFARALRSESGDEAAREPAAVPAQASQAAPGQTPGQAVAGSPAFQPAVPPQPVMQPAVPEGQSPPPQAAPPSALSDYVFQVAAFKDEDSVDALRQRLEGRGLRTRMQRDGKLFLVFVLLRGDAARAAEVPQIMQEMRLGEPIVRSRKPVF